MATFSARRWTPHGVDLADAAHPDRVVLIAISRAHRILCVVYAERGDGAILRISAPVAPRAMKRRSTSKSPEPSRASLREIPEVDLSSARVLGRGRHVDRARRSFEMLVIDRKVLKVLGGEEAVIDILQALAKSITANRRKHRAA